MHLCVTYVGAGKGTTENRHSRAQAHGVFEPRTNARCDLKTKSDVTRSRPQLTAVKNNFTSPKRTFSFVTCTMLQTARFKSCRKSQTTISMRLPSRVQLCSFSLVVSENNTIVRGDTEPQLKPADHVFKMITGLSMSANSQ